MMKRTLALFFYTLTLALLFPIFFPQLRLTFFAPFLVLSIYHHRRLTCLWIAFASGLIIDLLSAHTHFGSYSLNYCLTAWVLYPYKRYFYREKLGTVPIMTLLFTWLSTLITIILSYVLEESVTPLKSWLQTDLLWASFADMLYAGIAFTLPLLPFSYPQQRSLFLSSK